MAEVMLRTDNTMLTNLKAVTFFE